MRFSSLVFIAVVQGVASFSPASPTAFIATSSGRVASTASNAAHSVGCSCAACTMMAARSHGPGCSCGTCAPRGTALFSTEATDEVPAEVEAMDGVESAEEAHNAERPARKSLKKKGPRGKPLSEFNEGDTVTARVKSLASYGAFVDIGAQTDGLLHISQLSVDYVSDIKEVLDVGQEIEVRILNIDEGKNQIALSLLTSAQEEEAKEAASSRAPRRERQNNNNNRRDDSAVLAQLNEKGWDSEQFVEGTVVSTVDFGAFVRIDASKLNADVSGEIDGLVHISALAAGRVDSVSSVVSVNDKVQVRVKGIANRKVSLSMVSVEDEKAANAARSFDGPVEGNKEWREDLEKLQTAMPKFENRPLVVDLRK